MFECNERSVREKKRKKNTVWAWVDQSGTSVSNRLTVGGWHMYMTVTTIQMK